MKLKKLYYLFLIVFSTILLTSCKNETNSPAELSADNPLKLKMAVANGENTNYAKGARKIAEEVKNATNGKIIIDVVAGGALGGERDTVEFAMSGDLDIATAANSIFTNWIPEMGILDQAFLWDNANQAHAAVDGKIGELISKKAENLGLHVIGYMESGFRNVFSKKPIKNIEDFSGVKIRTMQNEYHMTAFEAFGAMPTSMAASEQFTGLQQGTIDACENAISNCLAEGYYEVTKNITYTNHAFVYIIIAMSDKAWQKIPQDLREPFMNAVKKGYQAQREYLAEANEEATKILKEQHNVNFYTIDNSLLKSKYKELAAKKQYKFDPEWQAAVDEVISSIK